jgi:hypothetical protein
MQPNNGGAPLLLKRAKLEGRPGVLTISRDAVSWQPDDPGSSQQPASVAVSAITSESAAALSDKSAQPVQATFAGTDGCRG